MFDLSFIWVLIGCSSCPYTLHKWVCDLNEKLGTGSKKFIAENPHACLFAGEVTSDYYRRINNTQFIQKLVTVLSDAGFSLGFGFDSVLSITDNDIKIKLLCAYNGKNDKDETPLKLEITQGTNKKTVEILEIDAIDEDGYYVDVIITVNGSVPT